jgi:hypothetical protein
MFFCGSFVRRLRAKHVGDFAAGHLGLFGATDQAHPERPWLSYTG